MTADVKTSTTRTAVVGIPDHADGESIARAAAHAALSLLTKVSASERGSVSIESVSITTPESVSVTSGLESILRVSSRSEKAVVVVARVEKPDADTKAAT